LTKTRRLLLLFVIATIFAGFLIDESAVLAANGEDKPEDDPLYQWLSHPLLIAGLGIIGSWLVIPSITRKWQDRQKEIAIKSSLVQKISQAETDIIESMSFRFVVKDESQKEQNFREWRSKSAIIGAEIRVYFKKEIVIEWNKRVYFPTTNLFLLFEGLDKQNSINHYSKLKKLLKNKTKHINWKLIKKECVDKDSIDFSNVDLRKMWDEITNLINEEKYVVINKILYAKVRGFSDKLRLSEGDEKLLPSTRKT